jgi:hypothetical protein
MTESLYFEANRDKAMELAELRSRLTFTDRMELRSTTVVTGRERTPATTPFSIGLGVSIGPFFRPDCPCWW